MRQAVAIPVALVLQCMAVAASAREPGAETDVAALLRRLAAAEARIQALEDRIRAQSPPVAPSPAAPANASAARAERPPAEGDQPPERPVTHRLVSLTFNGLVQAWYAAGDHGFRDTFRVRRSELYFNGQITEKARWQVMLDPAKALALDAGTAVNQSTRMLQNAVVTFDSHPRLRVSIGQFKLPLGLEGQQSSGRLDTVERALFASDRGRGGAFADVRDIGLMLRGVAGPRLEAQAGVFNGVAESQNDVDRNDQKALAGNVVVRPFAGLHVGASGAWGNGGGERPRRDRLGAEVQLVRGPLTLRSEVMTGRDGGLRRTGAYGHAGYRFTPRVEGVLRVDQWDPDTASDASSASAAERDYVAGVNVFLSQHNLKLQANYLRKTFRGGALADRDVVLVNTQTFW